jgi:hypothetical protein
VERRRDFVRTADPLNFTAFRFVMPGKSLAMT